MKALIGVSVLVLVTTAVPSALGAAHSGLPGSPTAAKAASDDIIPVADESGKTKGKRGGKKSASPPTTAARPAAPAEDGGSTVPRDRNGAATTPQPRT